VTVTGAGAWQPSNTHKNTLHAVSRISVQRPRP
jgi:hypothetical protein